MFKIALVQNISEMRNYSYADLRKDLLELGFEIQSFTRENIELLPSVLCDGKADCVLFASNSFNDKKIYEYVTAEPFVELFREYLNKKGACLVLHQNSLKGVEKPFPFIDDSVDRLESNYAEKHVSFEKAGGSTEAYFMFPNEVVINEVAEACYSNAAVSGKYWLLMRSASDKWSPIVLDNFGNSVVSRHNEKKVVFSSILLDYQKHNLFLQNILVNLLSDNKSLAILQSEDNDTLGFSYFLNSLENNKLYYKKYNNDEQGREKLIVNSKLGIHSTILVNREVMSSLPPKVIETIDKYGVKLIEINDQQFDKSDSFTVHSVDKSLALLFAKLELKVQEDLSVGFVSGSFMKTAEVLSKLKEFEAQGMTKGKYDKRSISHVLELISPHINEDGSYDKTFGATCKVLWLFSAFLGKDDSLTKAARNYIEKSSDVDTVRENLEKYYILSEFSDNPKKYLSENCSHIINDVIASNFEYITEYDFINVIKVATAIGDEKMLAGLFEYIKDNVSAGGELFNSYVTAIVASYLIDIYGIITNERIKERVREMLFDLVLYLRRVNIGALSLEEALQIVCALYKFETVVSFPIDDLTEIIFKTGTFPHEYHSFENHINIYQKTRMEIDSIESENKTLKKELKGMRIYKQVFFALLTALAVAIYLCVYLVLVLSESEESVISALMEKIKETWLSAFSVLMIPLITFVFNKFIRKKKDEEDK